MYYLITDFTIYDLVSQRFMPFPRALTQSEMQSVSSSI